jgi:hypothetical protein
LSSGRHQGCFSPFFIPSSESHVWHIVDAQEMKFPGPFVAGSYICESQS